MGKLPFARMPGRWYVVQFGDTLYSVSQKFNVPVPQLLNENGQLDESQVLFPGEILYIPRAQTEEIAEEVQAEEEAPETAAEHKRKKKHARKGKRLKRLKRVKR
jgi:LysM repeat protein